MSYSHSTISRVTEEFRAKPMRARSEASKRRAEIHAKFPEILKIDEELSDVGFKMYEIISSGRSEGEIKTALDELQKNNEELQKKRGLILMQRGYPADYTAVKYECEKCLDTGYVGIEMCECMRHALNEASFNESGLGGLSASQSFDTFDLDVYLNSPGDGIHTYGVMKMNFDICKKYAEEFSKSSPSMLFIGGVGLGKTHLSTAIGRAVIDRGYYCIYESAPNILLTFEKERFSRDSEADTDKYYDCDLLIIDDLGTEFSNRVSVSSVYNIINTRLVRQNPTIINTNLAYTKLEKQYDDRVISRLLGEFKVLKFEGIDYRVLKKTH